MAIFASQRRRGKEPSTPKKIAIGMGIAALAFIVMAVGSYFANLPLHEDIVAVGTSPVKVTPFLLMLTYLILTVAELYISPLGISFVSKVAPPKYQGIMPVSYTHLSNKYVKKDTCMCGWTEKCVKSRMV